MTPIPRAGGLGVRSKNSGMVTNRAGSESLVMSVVLKRSPEDLSKGTLKRKLLCSFLLLQLGVRADVPSPLPAPPAQARPRTPVPAAVEALPFAVQIQRCGARGAGIPAPRMGWDGSSLAAALLLVAGFGRESPACRP